MRLLPLNTKVPMARLTTLLLSAILLLAPTTQAAEPLAFSGIAFYSTNWVVKFDALPPGMSAAQVQGQLQAILNTVNDTLSTYQPDSELMRFNRAPVGQWVGVSPMLFAAASTATAVSGLSGGAFDSTVAPLVNLWGFGPQGRPRHIPSRRQIAAAKAQVGWQKLALDAGGPALQRKAAISLDLSSLGEGTGVDAMAAWLESVGITNYMAEVAGTFRVSGHKPDGSAWVIAIERPDESGLPQRALRLDNQVVSTSGLYRNYYEVKGVRYSHIINPKTGRPITHHGVSVTVVEPPGTPAKVADATATAFNVLGPEQGYALAARLHLPVFFIVSTGKGFSEKYTAEFNQYLLK